MTRRFYSKYCHPLWSRVVSCAALALYVLALVAMPALHGYVHDHLVEPCCEHSSDCDHPIPEDTCTLCEFARAAIPFCAVAESLLSQAEIDSKIFFTILTPSVADAAILPPCRAPPVL